MGRALAVAGIVAVVATAASARTLAPEDPLVERLARGDSVPGVQRFRVAATGRYVDHEVREGEAALLAALATAQANDDPDPFLDAFRSGVAWLGGEAAAGLAFGRVARGSEQRLEALEHARAHDAAFVARFLPELAALAREPTSAETPWHSTPSGRAVDCLAFLAGLTRVPEVRARARAALVDAVASAGEEPSVRAMQALGGVLSEGHDLDFSDDEKATLRPALAREIARGTSGRRSFPLEWLVAAVDPSLLDEAFRRSPDAWSLAPLVLAGWAPALADARLRARSPTRRDVEALARVSEQAIDAESAAAFARLLASRQSLGPDEETLVRALEKVGAAALLSEQVERDLRSADGGLLPATAQALLRVDPEAASRLREALPRLGDLTRAKLLCALVRSGALDLLPAVRAAVDGRRAGWEAYAWSLRALGSGVARGSAEAEGDFRRLERAWRALPILRDGRVHVDSVLGAVLRAYRDAGRLPAESEAMLLDSLRGLPDAGAFFAQSIVDVLADLGGPASEAALVELCGFRARAGFGVHDVRIAAREALGRREAHTGR